VFEVIIDPAKMSNCFIAESSGRMEKGKEVTWKFPEFDMFFPIRVGKIEKDKYISYLLGEMEGEEHLVEFTLNILGNTTIDTHGCFFYAKEIVIK
jgi:uncharacterized protein YndB with AHSA1/START domain